MYWYWILQLHTQQPLSMCHHNSIRCQLENYYPSGNNPCMLKNDLQTWSFLSLRNYQSHSHELHHSCTHVHICTSKTSLASFPGLPTIQYQKLDGGNNRGYRPVTLLLVCSFREEVCEVLVSQIVGCNYKFYWPVNKATSNTIFVVVYQDRPSFKVRGLHSKCYYRACLICTNWRCCYWLKIEH